MRVVAIMHQIRFALLATGSASVALGLAVYLVGRYGSSGEVLPSLPAGIRIDRLTALFIFLTVIVAFTCYGLSGIRRVQRLEKVPLVLILSLSLLMGAELIMKIPRYPSDVAAFLHYAGLVLLRGGNPYSEPMKPALELFNVPKENITELLGGGIASRFSYPSFSFLLYVPFIAAGLNDIRWIGLVSIIFGVLVAYFFTDSKYRPFVPLLLLFDISYTVAVAEGAGDGVWFLLCVVAVGLRNKHQTLSSIALGLAIAYKQIAWIFYPFFIILLWKEKGVQTAARATLVSSIVLGITNLPFALVDSRSYLGIFTNFLETTRTGSGLSLITQMGWMPLPPSSYLAVMAAATVILIPIYWRFHADLKAGGMTFPGLISFLAWGSFHRYAIWWPFLVLMLLEDDNSESSNSD